jgi:ADP-ribose pyrophosphatase
MATKLKLNTTAPKKSKKKTASLPIQDPVGVPAKPTKARAVVLTSKVSFKGKVFSVTTDTVTEPGGVTSVRDVVRHNGSVIILAVDTSVNLADPTIVIERQYRHAANQFLYELPAGRIEPGEADLAAAKRELIEETGFRAKKWSKLVKYYASPGFLAETMQVYLAEEIYPGVAEPEADEKITLLQIPLSELIRKIETGKILDGKTILSVLLFARRLAARLSKS